MVSVVLSLQCMLHGFVDVFHLVFTVCAFLCFFLEGIAKLLDDRGFSEFEKIMDESEQKVVIEDRSPTMNKGKAVLTTEESHYTRANTLYRNSGESFNGR